MAGYGSKQADTDTQSPRDRDQYEPLLGALEVYLEDHVHYVLFGLSAEDTSIASQEKRIPPYLSNFLTLYAAYSLRNGPSLIIFALILIQCSSTLCSQAGRRVHESSLIP